MTTGRLGNVELAPGQADPEATVNEADAYIATLANLAACVGVLVNDPPSGASPVPAEYDTYVVGIGTGDWLGHNNEITFYYNGAWQFVTPLDGMEARDVATGDKYVYLTATWTIEIPGGGGGGAPANADYLVKTAHASLSAERVVTDTSTITLDWATAGQAKFNTVRDSTTEILTGTDTNKSATADAIAALWEAGADITDGATITIGEGGYFNLITSTTAITAFTVTTDKAGRTFRCRFNTIRTLTHNATSLILPTAANITTALGDIAQFRSLASGNVVCEWYTRADGTALAATGSAIGKQTIWIPASAMVSATTSGPASAQVETATNDINFNVLDFDATADEHAHFNVAFPKSWNLGTVTFQAWWTTAATGTTGVAWGLQGVAISDNEASDAAWGTAVVVTDDAQSAALEILVTAESSAVTIGGTPADDDIVFFRIFRDVSDANDDMTEDARLIGVKIFFTTDAATDA